MRRIIFATLAVVGLLACTNNTKTSECSNKEHDHDHEHKTEIVEKAAVVTETVVDTAATEAMDSTEVVTPDSAAVAVAEEEVVSEETAQ